MPCQHKHTLPSQAQIRYSGCLCDPHSSASSNEVAVQIEIQISICIGNLEGIFQSRVEEGKRSICERKLLYITSFVTVEVNCWQADFVNAALLAGFVLFKKCQIFRNKEQKSHIRPQIKNIWLHFCLRHNLPQAHKLLFSFSISSLVQEVRS